MARQKDETSRCQNMMFIQMVLFITHPVARVDAQLVATSPHRNRFNRAGHSTRRNDSDRSVARIHADTATSLESCSAMVMETANEVKIVIRRRRAKMVFLIGQWTLQETDGLLRSTLG